MDLNGLNQYLAEDKCLAQGQNAVPPVRLKPTTPQDETSTLPPSHPLLSVYIGSKSDKQYMHSILGKSK